MKLSKLTISLGIFIIISASFMRQAWDLGTKILGKDILTLFFILLCLIAGLAIIYQNVKSGFKISRLLLMILMAGLGFWFAWKQPYPAEKTHILEYGLLGWLAMRDLAKTNKNLLKNIVYAIIFALIIGSLDEGFQKLLPWRVFEIRDIKTNVISGILGIALFIVK